MMIMHFIFLRLGTQARELMLQFTQLYYITGYQTHMAIHGNYLEQNPLKNKKLYPEV